MLLSYVLLTQQVATAKTKHSYIFKKNKAFLEDNNPALVLQR